ncbi:testis-expressed protein 10 [Diachasma alloeum]|uniref:testis-expressed protein 10 n=1 Tax=Diachasma alloeum TaxID=454923 RepID=UPI0007383985|nr:testis-expressed protein 10 [Diachasma alloeum]
MGKNHRHQKNLKSERSKVKLKAKKPKILPKGQNLTDTSFKVKKIIIREQLKSHELDEIVSRRKLNVKELLTRLQHHNSAVRQEAIKELKEILQNYPPELLSSHLNALLQGISSLALDKERDIRRDTLRVLSLVLSPLSSDQLSPFSEILVSYLRCAMTHINPSIKEDSLAFLDVLVHSCPFLVSRNARKILPNFLDMISSHNHTSTSRQLTTTLSSRNTAIKWRVKVLQRLSSIFNSIINDLRSQKNLKRHSEVRKILVDDDTNCLSFFWGNNLDICNIGADEDEGVLGGAGFSEDDFKRYVKVLVPLMMDSWVEVRPKEVEAEGGSLLSQEAVEMLRVIVKIFMNFLDILEVFDGEEVSEWFGGEVSEGFAKFFGEGFPYGAVKRVERGRKRQGDFGEGDEVGVLQENLGVGVVLAGIVGRRPLGELEREGLEGVVQYVCERLRNWSSNDAPALPILSNFLRILFLKASKNLYGNGVNLGNILRGTISAACRQPKRELQNHLFGILGDIVLDHRLNELQRESSFKNFVKTLPDLLLNENIHDNTIQMLNRAVLQHGTWIRGELAKKQDQIIENAKRIEIIGSPDDKESRLMICNLLHFLDGQIYF